MFSAPGAMMGVALAFAFPLEGTACVRLEWSQRVCYDNWYKKKVYHKTYQQKVSTMDEWQVVRRKMEFSVGSSH